MKTISILEALEVIRMYRNGSLTWTTREGKVMPVKDMTDTHLINTINMLKRNQAQESYEEFEEELWDDIMACSDILDKDYWDASDID